jgi:hypothetical protein
MIIADPQRPDTLIELPPPSDDAVVQIHGFLEELLSLFESRYHWQIYRCYEAMSARGLNEQRAAHHSDEPPC